MRHSRRELITAILLITPAVIAVAIFVYGFIGWTLFISTTAWDSMVPDFSFVGLENYAELFSGFRFQADLRNTFFFTALFIIGCLVIGLTLAILLDQRIEGEGVFRSIYLFPMAISFVVTGVVWRWLFNPNTGINLLLETGGLDFLTSRWYTNPTILFAVDVGRIEFGVPVALVAVVIAATWQMSGFAMAMYLAGMRGISEQLREAARIDGASELQIYRHVILPLLSPITLSAVIILGHISLKIFDLIYTMTGSGPAFATDVPAVFMFETTFRGNQFAQGAAIAIIMLVMVAVVIVPYLLSSVRGETRL